MDVPTPAPGVSAPLPPNLTLAELPSLTHAQLHFLFNLGKQAGNLLHDPDAGSSPQALEVRTSDLVGTDDEADDEMNTATKASALHSSPPTPPASPFVDFENNRNKKPEMHRNHVNRRSSGPRLNSASSEIGLGDQTEVEPLCSAVNSSSRSRSHTSASVLATQKASFGSDKNYSPLQKRHTDSESGVTSKYSSLILDEVSTTPQDTSVFHPTTDSGVPLNMQGADGQSEVPATQKANYHGRHVNSEVEVPGLQDHQPSNSPTQTQASQLPTDLLQQPPSPKIIPRSESETESQNIPETHTPVPPSSSSPHCPSPPPDCRVIRVSKPSHIRREYTAPPFLISSAKEEWSHTRFGSAPPGDADWKQGREDEPDESDEEMDMELSDGSDMELEPETPILDEIASFVKQGDGSALRDQDVADELVSESEPERASKQPRIRRKAASRPPRVQPDVAIVPASTRSQTSAVGQRKLGYPIPLLRRLRNRNLVSAPSEALASASTSSVAETVVADDETIQAAFEHVGENRDIGCGEPMEPITGTAQVDNVDKAVETSDELSSLEDCSSSDDPEDSSSESELQEKDPGIVVKRRRSGRVPKTLRPLGRRSTRKARPLAQLSAPAIVRARRRTRRVLGPNVGGGQVPKADRRKATDNEDKLGNRPEPVVGDVVGPTGEVKKRRGRPKKVGLSTVGDESDGGWGEEDSQPTKSPRAGGDDKGKGPEKVPDAQEGEKTGAEDGEQVPPVGTGGSGEDDKKTPWDNFYRFRALVSVIPLEVSQSDLLFVLSNGYLEISSRNRRRISTAARPERPVNKDLSKDPKLLKWEKDPDFGKMTIRAVVAYRTAKERDTMVETCDGLNVEWVPGAGVGGMTALVVRKTGDRQGPIVWIGGRRVAEQWTEELEKELATRRSEEAPAVVSQWTKRVKRARRLADRATDLEDTSDDDNSQPALRPFVRPSDGHSLSCSPQARRKGPRAFKKFKSRRSTPAGSPSVPLAPFSHGMRLTLSDLDEGERVAAREKRRPITFVKDEPVTGDFLSAAFGAPSLAPTASAPSPAAEEEPEGDSAQPAPLSPGPVHVKGIDADPWVNEKPSSPTSHDDPWANPEVPVEAHHRHSSPAAAASAPLRTSGSAGASDVPHPIVASPLPRAVNSDDEDDSMWGARPPTPPRKSGFRSNVDIKPVLGVNAMPLIPKPEPTSPRLGGNGTLFATQPQSGPWSWPHSATDIPARAGRDAIDGNSRTNEGAPQSSASGSGSGSRRTSWHSSNSHRSVKRNSGKADAQRASLAAPGSEAGRDRDPGRRYSPPGRYERQPVQPPYLPVQSPYRPTAGRSRSPERPRWNDQAPHSVQGGRVPGPPLHRHDRPPFRRNSFSRPFDNRNNPNPAWSPNRDRDDRRPNIERPYSAHERSPPPRRPNPERYVRPQAPYGARDRPLWR